MDISTISSGAADVVSSREQGFAALTADDFMTMLVTELQNQDPLNPMDNSELVNQLSTMQSMQSNVELSEALKQLTTGQTLSSAAGLIGKSVAGTLGGQEVRGVVDRVFIEEGEIRVGVGDDVMGVDLLTEIA